MYKTHNAVRDRQITSSQQAVWRKRGCNSVKQNRVNKPFVVLMTVSVPSACAKPPPRNVKNCVIFVF